MIKNNYVNHPLCYTTVCKGLSSRAKPPKKNNFSIIAQFTVIKQAFNFHLQIVQQPPNINFQLIIP